jgi:hypothetical protein
MFLICQFPSLCWFCKCVLESLYIVVSLHITLYGPPFFSKSEKALGHRSLVDYSQALRDMPCEHAEETDENKVASVPATAEQA